MDDLREVTIAERAALLGTEDFLGVTLEVWGFVERYNKQPGRPFRDCISVDAAPLLAAVYRAGQESISSHAEQVAEREMIQAQQPVVNEEGS